MAGVILIVAGYAGVGRLMRYVPMPGSGRCSSSPSA
jgi:hypothetical protein